MTNEFGKDPKLYICASYTPKRMRLVRVNASDHSRKLLSLTLYGITELLVTLKSVYWHLTCAT